MKALLLEQDNNVLTATVKDVDTAQLPQGNVTVDVTWSGLNYKDALAITRKGKIIRNFPMVPGIDFTGTVSHSEDLRYQPGQNVILTGWGVGENHWGGLAEQARVNGDWLTPLPSGMTARQAMIIGTARFTAMLCVKALEDGGVTPQSGDIIVTGASGGVGSTAVALLAKLGYSVYAVSGRESNTDYLLKLGAKAVLAREEFSAQGRPLEKQRWAGAVDTTGGQILANLLAQMHYNATVAACGLAGGFTLPTTVMPFILRNVRLQGVDSVSVPTEKRPEIWARLLKDLPADYYLQAATEISLSDAVSYAEKLMNNAITGRTLVNIRG